MSYYQNLPSAYYKPAQWIVSPNENWAPVPGWGLVSVPLPHMVGMGADPTAVALPEAAAGQNVCGGSGSTGYTYNATTGMCDAPDGTTSTNALWCSTNIDANGICTAAPTPQASPSPSGPGVSPVPAAGYAMWIAVALGSVAIIWAVSR